MPNNNNKENKWEDWVKVLSNSKNPHDKDLLIVKIKVLLEETSSKVESLAIATEQQRIVGLIEGMKQPDNPDELGDAVLEEVIRIISLDLITQKK